MMKQVNVVMKAHASLLQPSPAINSPADQGDPAASTAPPGVWSRFVAWVRSWFEIPYGYQDETGFHYGPQPPPVFTDRAQDAMTYPMVLPKLTSEVPDPSSVPSALVAPTVKD